MKFYEQLKLVIKLRYSKRGYRVDNVTVCWAAGQTVGVITHHDDVDTSSDDVIVNDDNGQRKTGWRKRTDHRL